jgi:hypothetical protein
VTLPEKRKKDDEFALRFTYTTLPPSEIKDGS